MRIILRNTGQPTTAENILTAMEKALQVSCPPGYKWQRSKITGAMDFYVDAVNGGNVQAVFHYGLRIQLIGPKLTQNFPLLNELKCDEWVLILKPMPLEEVRSWFDLEFVGVSRDSESHIDPWSQRTLWDLLLQFNDKLSSCSRAEAA